MILKIFKDSTLISLKNSVDNTNNNTIKNYASISNNWVSEYFNNLGIEQYLITTNIVCDDFELIIGDQNSDAENAIIIHKALSNLLPIQARDEKLWAYLCHTKFWNYMIKRWPIEHNVDPKKLASRIKSRYFFQGKTENVIKTGTVPYVRNGISRLWWAGYIVYDERLENPYEYMKELFLSQDMYVGLCERDLAKNKDVVISILKGVRKYNLKNINNNTELVRNILKEINLRAGLVNFDALEVDLLESLIYGVFEQEIKRNREMNIIWK